MANHFTSVIKTTSRNTYRIRLLLMSRKYGASFAEILAATNVTGEGGLTGRGVKSFWQTPKTPTP